MREFSVHLRELSFEPNNPRLIGDFGDNEYQKMFRYLITDIGVEDLLECLSASGLFEVDPIIVRDQPPDGYYVVDGNRRVAALKLLTGERPNDALSIPAIPAPMPEEISKTFDPIKVQNGWTPELLQAYLGYKHVTAAREWSPEAKAKFVFACEPQLFRRESSEIRENSVGKISDTQTMADCVSDT